MKKLITTTLILTVGTLVAFANDDYTVFRVCQDQHVIRTSDGAEAGHVSYVVIDPGSEQIVSAVITGGVLADRNVAVPITDLQFGTDREVTLTSIDRENLLSAPPVETREFDTTYVVQPAVIEKTYTHFNADVSFLKRGGGTAFEDRTRLNGNNPAESVGRDVSVDQRNADQRGMDQRSADQRGMDQRSPDQRSADKSMSGDTGRSQREHPQTANRDENKGDLNASAESKHTAKRSAAESTESTQSNRPSAAFGGSTDKSLHDQSATRSSREENASRSARSEERNVSGDRSIGSTSSSQEEKADHSSGSSKKATRSSESSDKSSQPGSASSLSHGSKEGASGSSSSTQESKSGAAESEHQSSEGHHGSDSSSMPPE